jgi:hypothetical protein
MTNLEILQAIYVAVLFVFLVAIIKNTPRDRLVSRIAIPITLTIVFVGVGYAAMVYFFG